MNLKKDALDNAPKRGTIAPIMSSVSVNDNMSLILFGKTRRAILSQIYGHADETFYLRQLARMAEAGMGAVQRELKTLTGAGILTRTAKGKQVYYQANPQCPVFAELKGLILKTAGMGDILKTALAPLAERIRIAFIYGSLARSEESKRSDVDIMIIGDVSFADIVAALSPAQQNLNREINPSVYPVKEFEDKLSKGHHFLQSVFEGDKWFLIGGEHDLARLANQRTANTSQDNSTGN